MTYLRGLFKLLLGGGVYVATLTDNYTISTTAGSLSAQVYGLTPSGADRQIILPDPNARLVGTVYLITNSATSGAYSILVRGKTLTVPGVLSSESTIGTIANGVTAFAICHFDGTYYRWRYQPLSSLASLVLTGTLAALVVSTDTISEQTAAAGVTVDGVLLKDNSVTVGTGGQVSTNTIAEKTGASGVTVDGCLIKDGRAALLATAGMFTSTEQTGTGSSQNVAHGFGAAPSMWWAVPTDTTSGWVVSAASTDATNVAITVTTGAKFRVYALK